MKPSGNLVEEEFRDCLENIDVMKERTISVLINKEADKINAKNLGHLPEKYKSYKKYDL